MIAACARGRGWRGRLATSVLLQLLGWAFVLHVVYVAWGLALSAALSWWSGPREQRRRDVLDALVPLAVNAVLTGPIVVRLVADRLARTPDAYSELPASAAHLLEPTARVGAVFLVAVWGGWIAFRRGDRMGRLLSVQLLGALSIWAGYAGLSVLGLVEQPDEIYYWLRVLTGALAGVGLWDLAGRAGGDGVGPRARSRAPRGRRLPGRAAVDGARVSFTGDPAGNFVAVLELQPPAGGGPSWTSNAVARTRPAGQ